MRFWLDLWIMFTRVSQRSFRTMLDRLCNVETHMTDDIGLCTGNFLIFLFAFERGSMVSGRNVKREKSDEMKRGGMRWRNEKTKTSKCRMRREGCLYNYRTNNIIKLKGKKTVNRWWKHPRKCEWDFLCYTKEEKLSQTEKFKYMSLCNLYGIVKLCNCLNMGNASRTQNKAIWLYSLMNITDGEIIQTIKYIQIQSTIFHVQCPCKNDEQNIRSQYRSYDIFFLINIKSVRIWKSWSEFT